MVWFFQDRRDRSLEEEEVNERTTTTDESIDEDKSDLDGLEDKKGSSKVVSNFFETLDLLLLLGVE